MTLAGAAGANSFTKAVMHKRNSNTVTYKVKGFTCVTCAAGLETLLGREKGVLAVHATYPEGIATVNYDPEATSEAVIASVIENMGFHAQSLPSAHL